MIHIFEDQITCQLQKVIFENLGIASKPPWKPYLLKEGFWRKMLENRPQLFFYFLLFSKNPSNCLKTAILPLLFSRMLLLKDAVFKGAWMSCKNFQKSLFGIVLKFGLQKYVSHLWAIYFVRNPFRDTELIINSLKKCILE